MSVLRRGPKPEPTLRLDGSTMVVCVEGFRPGAVSRVIERGEWLRLDNPAVLAFPALFAVRLLDVDPVFEHDAA